SNGTRCYRARTTYPGGIPSPYSNVVSAVVQLTVSAPTVNITSPAEGANFPSGSNITITADAADDDGTVTKVEFFEGANKLGEDATGPSTYSFTWMNVSPGSYTLSATATDNDGTTATSDPVHITVTDSQLAEDIEDDDPRVSYSNGWHLVNDADASDGHFRLNTGKDTQHGTGLAFTATGGGKITYYFARSKKGGSAEVALVNSSGITLEARQVNYLGSVGSARDPEFNDNVYQEEFVAPAAGNYTLALRNINGAVYIDRFKLESSTSSAQPASGPGQTSSSVNTVKLGKDLLQSITVPANVQAISVMAEATPELPIQLVLIDPSGAVLSTANNSTGFAVINKNVTQPGVYVIKVVNVSLGPVQVWTAATPLVLR
ncbi:MAG: Ig-like domain-containing protein, partial [Pyrinomonadaceae bacterium]